MASEENTTNSEESAAAPAARTLGVERWVQFGFIAFAAAIFWLSDKLITLVWDRFADPDPTTVSIAAALLGVGGAFVAFKNEPAHDFAHEAAVELSRVNWPSRKETWSNTAVVVVTSIIAAIILFAFDATWSAITDLIYKA